MGFAPLLRNLVPAGSACACILPLRVQPACSTASWRRAPRAAITSLPQSGGYLAYGVPVAPTLRACVASARSRMLWCALPASILPPAAEARPRCSKFGFGKVPGGGYKPERSRGEILCFFIVGRFLVCVLNDYSFSHKSADTKCHLPCRNDESGEQGNGAANCIAFPRT